MPAGKIATLRRKGSAPGVRERTLQLARLLEVGKVSSNERREQSMYVGKERSEASSMLPVLTNFLL